MIFSVRVLPVEELLDVRVANVVLAQDRLFSVFFFFFLKKRMREEERDTEDEKKR